MRPVMHDIKPDSCYPQAQQKAKEEGNQYTGRKENQNSVYQDERNKDGHSFKKEFPVAGHPYPAVRKIGFHPLSQFLLKGSSCCRKSWSDDHCLPVG